MGIIVLIGLLGSIISGDLIGMGGRRGRRL